MNILLFSLAEYLFVCGRIPVQKLVDLLQVDQSPFMLFNLHILSCDELP